MLNVQQYLNTDGNTLDTLKEEFGIRSKSYESGIVVLNYDQISSPKNHPITNECRGLILDYTDSYRVVSKSFDRFFNLGECDNIPQSWDGYLFLEKADGSIIKVYNHDDVWYISTRGTAYAEAEMMIGDLTFKEYVLETLGFKLGFDDTEFQDWANKNLDVSFTYVFEIIGPENRVVTPYTRSELVLLGIVNNINFSESFEWIDQCVQYWNHPKIRVAKRYSATSTEELEQLVSDLKGLEEGVVCYHPITNNRIKVKNKAYLACHRLRGETGVPTNSNVAELVVINEFGEFLVYFPEFRPLFQKFIDLYEGIIADAVATYESVKHIQDQKEFALAIKHVVMSSVLFTARNKNISVLEAISTAKTSFLVKLLLEKNER